VGQDKPAPANPRISIIIPTIGRPLGPTEESIANQTIYPQTETIVVHDVNRRGAPWARNQGFLEAKAEFLFFCDDDVVLRPKALERLLQALTAHPAASYAYGDYKYYNHPLTGNGIHRAHEFSVARLLVGNYISTMSLIRREPFISVGGWAENVPFLQDHRLWLDMATNGYKGQYVPGVLFSTTYSEGITTEATRR
jgi:glycosyltransferase involved in cell wall biosynthesis